MSTTAALACLTESIGPQLAAVDALFHRELASDLRCVNALVKHVGRFRGKMLRPCLVLLAGKAVAPAADPGESHVALATVVEMCDHAAWLDKGVLRTVGDVDSTVEAYQASLH